MNIIPPEQIGAYLEQAKNEGVLPIFYLELTTGLRRGELLALLWEDVDVEAKTISVSKSVCRLKGELLVTPPKTQNSIRTVAISQKALELLLEEHDRHPDNPILFPSPRTGTYWSPECIGRVHKKLLKNAGIDENVRLHTGHLHLCDRPDAESRRTADAGRNGCSLAERTARSDTGQYL